MVNMAKIDEVMARIEEEYAKGESGEFCAWNQETWAEKTRCGTSYCFAGWRVVLDGGVPHFFFPIFDVEFDSTERAILSDGKEVYIRRYARDALGLTEGDAEKLFDGENNIDDLRRMVEWLREYGSLDEY